MTRKPYYKILDRSAGTDTDLQSRLMETLAPYVSRVQLHDRGGGRSDAIEIHFADDGTVALPPEGSRLGLAIGYHGADRSLRTQMTVDQYMAAGGSAEPDIIKMSATGADFTSQMRAKRERTHEPMTLGNLLAILTEPYDVEPVVRPASLASLQLPLIDQAGKSDLALAVEIADTYGGIFKPADGQWVILGYDAIGPSQLTIDKSDVGQYNAHFIARRQYPTVVAHYHDDRAAQRVPVRVGSGADPVTVLDRTFASEQIARAHATARLNRGIRQARRLTLELEGRPDLKALSLVTLTGFRQELNRDWLITEVTHTIDERGYRCRVSAEGVADDPIT